MSLILTDDAFAELDKGFAGLRDAIERQKAEKSALKTDHDDEVLRILERLEDELKRHVPTLVAQGLHQAQAELAIAERYAGCFKGIKGANVKMQKRLGFSDTAWSKLRGVDRSVARKARRRVDLSGASGDDVPQKDQHDAPAVKSLEADNPCALQGAAELLDASLPDHLLESLTARDLKHLQKLLETKLQKIQGLMP